MMWRFDRVSGVLSYNAKEVARGYSGHGMGKNNPGMEAMSNVGPIPGGKWTFGQPFDHATHGKYCMRLTPFAETYTFSRDGFLVHGDSATHPGEASLGCIVVPRYARVQMHVSGGDRTVEVV